MRAVINFQSIRTNRQYPGKYRHDKLVDGLNGRSPREVAKAAGLSHQKVYDALDGNCKKIDTLWRLSIVVKVPMADLFEDI